MKSTEAEYNKLYIKQLEKDNTDLKDEIKHWQISWDILTKENAELKSNDLYISYQVLDKQLAELKKLHEKLIFILAGKDKQLADIKYLNRDEVEKIIETIYPLYPPTGKKNITYHQAITAICNLAIPKSQVINYSGEFGNIQFKLDPTLRPDELVITNETDEVRVYNLAIKPITKDKIIEVLKKYFILQSDYESQSLLKDKLIIDLYETIANEILNDKEE